MKITKKYLQKVIEEEVATLLHEGIAIQGRDYSAAVGRAANKFSALLEKNRNPVTEAIHTYMIAVIAAINGIEAHMISADEDQGPPSPRDLEGAGATKASRYQGGE